MVIFHSYVSLPDGITPKSNSTIKILDDSYGKTDHHQFMIAMSPGLFLTFPELMNIDQAKPFSI